MRNASHSIFSSPGPHEPDRGPARVLRALRAVFEGTLLDWVAPPRCPACNQCIAGVPREAGLCPTCAVAVLPYERACLRCGTPVDVPESVRDGCGVCSAGGWVVAGSQWAWEYGGPVADAIARLKYHGAPDVARGLASGFVWSGPPPDIVVPVPLHHRRLWKRGYNQAALIARPVARALGVPLVTDALIRHRETGTQTSHAAASRFRNVRGAFRVSRPSRVVGMDVLLVDDVLTTGATINACAKALRDAGAARVFAWTVARG